MKKSDSNIDRRQMLKYLGIGAAALGMPGASGFGRTLGKIFTGNPDMSKVSITKGNDCRDITYQSLMNIEDEIMASLEGKKRILLKPNLVNTSVPLCATSVDSIRGILDFLRPRWKGPIVLGESTANSSGTFEGFKNFGYLPLEKEYGITLADLNEGNYVHRYALGADNAPVSVPILSTFFDKDQYIISAAKMKTHDRVLVTLSLKNILLAAPLNRYGKNNHKRSFHMTGERSKNTILHYNMFMLAQEVYPDLGVIDGFEAMEGNGPVGGTPVDMRISMASLDPLALDTVATKCMGFDPSQILYFTELAKAGLGQNQLENIQILGNDINEFQYRFEASRRMKVVYGLG